MNIDSVKCATGGIFLLKGPLNWYAGSAYTPEGKVNLDRKWVYADTINERFIVILEVKKGICCADFDARSALIDPMAPHVDIVALIPGKGICNVWTCWEYVDELP